MLGLRKKKAAASVPCEAPAPAVLDARGNELLRLPEPGAAMLPSSLAFSLYKAGSTLLSKVLEDLAPHAGVRAYNLEKELFRLGIEHRDLPKSVAGVFRERGYCYTVFRSMPFAYEIPIFENAPKLLLVRDPRDILVSHYFSMGKTHPTPGDAVSQKKRERFDRERQIVQTTTVDEHALRKAELFRRYFAEYDRRLLAQPNLRIDRYEDIVFSKPDWVDAICGHLGWEIEVETRASVAQKHDIVPEDEQGNRHIRRVRPGDHVEKLRPETIASLNETFAPVLERYGYDR